MNLTVRYKKTLDHSPKVGVALSGGGLRGAAHIGVLKTLSQANIPIHFIAGTSAGAVVAAMFACGYPPLINYRYLHFPQYLAVFHFDNIESALRIARKC